MDSKNSEQNPTNTHSVFEGLENRRLMAGGSLAAMKSAALVNSQTVSTNVISRAVTATVGSVTSFALVNAANGALLKTLTNGMTVDLNQLSTSNVAIVAKTQGSIDQVKFGVNKNAKYRTESEAPFALDGDRKGGFTPMKLGTGGHSLSATPINDDASGSTLKVNVTFTRGATPAPTPTPEPEPEPTPTPTPDNSVGTVTSLVLVNAANGDVVKTLTNGATIDVSTLPTQNLAVVAKVSGSIGSITFGVGDNAAYRSESSAPYALDGDVAGKTFNKMPFGNGTHTLSATPSYQSATGNQLKVTFTLVNVGTTPAPTPTPTPTPNPLPDPTPTPTPTPNPTPNPAPNNTAKPNASNTGPYNSSILKNHNGLFTTSQDGQVIENLIINGGVDIRHNNVTLRNCIVLNRGIKVHKGFENWLVEHVEVTGSGIGTGLVTNEAGRGTARRMEIHHVSSDGMRPGSNQVFEYNYVHHLGMGPESHADGIQFYHADGGLVFRNITVRYNVFDMPEESGFRSNAAIFMGHRVEGFLAENNWFNGGGFTATRGDANTDVVYRNNWFGRDAKFGVRSNDPGWNSTTWSNNRYWDNGELITGRR